MDIKLFESFDGSQMRTIMINEEVWFVAVDVCKILDISNVTATISRLDNDDVMLSVVPTSGGNQNMNIVNESGLYNLITKNRKIGLNKKKDIIKYFNDFGILNNINLYSSKESDFIDSLEEQLEVFCINKGIKQYRIDDYKVDYFISDYGIIIEFDENYHKNYSYNKHEGRQKYIENKYKYKFIRVSDKESCLKNCAFVIKELLALEYLPKLIS